MRFSFSCQNLIKIFAFHLTFHFLPTEFCSTCTLINAIFYHPSKAFTSWFWCSQSPMSQVTVYCFGTFTCLRGMFTISCVTLTRHCDLLTICCPQHILITTVISFLTAQQKGRSMLCKCFSYIHCCPSGWKVK